MLINELLAKAGGVVSEHGLGSRMSRSMPGDEIKGSATPQPDGEGLNEAADGDIAPPDSAVISEHKRMLSELVGQVD